MVRFPYKIQLTLPENMAKSEMNKLIMGLRPSAYRVSGVSFIQYEWEYKTKMHRDNFLSRVVEIMKDLPSQKYEISIVDS